MNLKRKPTPGTQEERITMTRRKTFVVGGISQVFWYDAAGQPFCGRACHMKALASSRALAARKVTP